MLRQRRPFFLSRGFWRALQIAFPWTLPFAFVFLPDVCLLQRFYTLQFLSANLKSSHNIFWLILYLKNVALTNKVIIKILTQTGPLSTDDTMCHLNIVKTLKRKES